MRLLLVVVVLCAGCAAAPEARYEEYRDRIEREAAALLAARPANAPLEVTYDELTEIATRGGALQAPRETSSSSIRLPDRRRSARRSWCG